ncbi:MAG: hypothetical protein WC370_08230 [Dehalococcoidales bacterium]|jgi:hypothetical protein
MGIIGLGISLLALVFMVIGLVPFLGWLNWFTTLPLAVIGATLGGSAAARSRSPFGIAGLIIGVLVFFIGAGRLFVGCGIF